MKRAYHESSDDSDYTDEEDSDQPTLSSNRQEEILINENNINNTTAINTRSSEDSNNHNSNTTNTNPRSSDNSNSNNTNTNPRSSDNSNSNTSTDLRSSENNTPKTNSNNDNICNKHKRQKVETDVLTEIESFLKSPDSYESEVKTIKLRYLIAIFKKTMKENSLCSDILSPDMIEDATPENLEKAYCYVKIITYCDNQMQRMRSLGHLTNTASCFVGQILHDRYIKPLASGYVSDDVLREAFSAYQTEIAEHLEPDPYRCISYIIQEEIDNEKPIRIPHPLINSLTTQISASCKYVVKIMSGIAQGYIKNPIANFVIPPEAIPGTSSSD